MTHRKLERAFPQSIEHGDGSYEQHFGMTLRDYFAAHAIQGLLSSPRPPINEKGDVDCEDGNFARAAYQLADAMLAERSKQ